MIGKGHSLGTTAPLDLSASFSVVYEGNQARLRNWLIAKTRNDTVADDLLSETFLRAWQHWAAFDGKQSPARVRGWLWRIAGNCHIDWWREKARQNESLDKPMTIEGTPRGEMIVDQGADMDDLVERWDRTARVVRAAGKDLPLLMELYWWGGDAPTEAQRVRIWRFRNRLLGKGRTQARRFSLRWDAARAAG